MGHARVMAQVTAQELAARLGTEDAPVLIDVREPDEFEGWSIRAARNIPLARLRSHVDEIQRDRDIVVVCASGARSSQAVDDLRTAGITASNLVGGMEAWGSVFDTAVIDLGAARIVQVRRRGKGCLSYVVGAGDEAFVVDPSGEVDRYVSVARAEGWKVTRVFDTHLHADHVSSARLLAAETGATLHLNPADSYDFEFEALTEAGWFDLGGHVHLGVTAFAAPGHTKGSTVLEVGGRAILTGDTLFVDGVGRPDLADQAEEFARDLFRSLHTKVLALPSEALVLPAHYGDAVDVLPGKVVGATLATLRGSLPQLEWDQEEFVRWAAGRATPRPPHYVEIVRANMGRMDLTPEEVHRIELGPNRCAA